MNTILSFVKRFGLPILIASVLLTAFAYKAVLANTDSGSFAQARRQMFITASRVNVLNQNSIGTLHNVSRAAELPPAVGNLTSGGELEPTNEAGDDNGAINPVENETEFTGVVSSISATGMMVDKLTVLFDANTEMDAGIVVGTLVKVEGSTQTDGSLLASEVKVVFLNNLPGTATPTPEATDDNKNQGNDNNHNNPSRVEFQGQLTAVNGNVWTVDGMLVLVSSKTEIKGNPKVGDMVRVQGVKLTDGSIQASEIQFRDNHQGENTRTPEPTKTMESSKTPEMSKTPAPTTAATNDHGGNQNGNGDNNGGGSNSGGGDHNGGGDHGGGGNHGGDGHH